MKMLPSTVKVQLQLDKGARSCCGKEHHKLLLLLLLYYMSKWV